MKDQDQPLVVVTGASRGIGRATCFALVQDHGCHVLAVARSQAGLASLSDECGGPEHVSIVAVDLAATDAPDRIKSVVAGRKLAALVNNAGTLITRSIDGWSEEDLLTGYRMNAVVPFMLARALFVELSGDPPGHVVNIGSMGGFQSSVKFPGLLGYSSSKAALANISECLAVEWADRGVRVNCLCLGSVDTEMLRAAFPGFKATTSPKEIAEFISHFALHGHKSFNGKVLPVATGTP